MSVITSSYRTYNTKNFIEDMVANTSPNEYYVFGSDINISAAVNSEFSKNDFLENVLFGKKIQPESVFYLIDNNRWTFGTIFDQYDDREDLTDKKFYTIVYPTDNTTGDYRVFKCLFNNYNAPSTQPPNYIEIQNEQIYRTSDGYVWKYMYAITPIDFEKYRVLSYVPIIGENSGDIPISKSSISAIILNNPDTNRGYEYRTGVIDEVSSQNITISSRNKNLSNIEDFYTNQNFYVISNDNNAIFNGQPTLYTIDTYKYDELKAQAIITIKENIDLLASNSPIKKNYTFRIFPRVEISGDGAGAIARPYFPDGADEVIGDNVKNRITSIEILKPGSGYTNATARIINPALGFDTLGSNSLDIEAILRPILSPKGGHASNFAEELKSRRALIYNTFADTENFAPENNPGDLKIPSSNVYTKVGIVKNPVFTGNSPDIFDNRLFLSLNSSVLEQNEFVTQSNLIGDTTFTAQVHEIRNDGAFLCNYHGPYKNYAVETSTEKGYSDIPINLKRPIVSSQGQVLSINTDEITGEYIVARPPYVQKTGEVYIRILRILHANSHRFKHQPLL